MERLKKDQKSGLTAAGVYKFGVLFYTVGIFGRCVLQNQLLGMNVEGANVLENLTAMPNGMLYATIALIFQMVETCSVPIFSFLLVEGARNTSDFKKYFIRLLTLAVISEIPFNLAYSGKILDFGSRNPVFALVLCLVLIYFYKRYADKSLKNMLIKAMVTLAGAGWAAMLGINNGICFIVIASILWIFREKPMFRTIMGCSATVLCTLFSLYYLAAPMSFLIIHFYNGERGERTLKMDYAAYPLILALIGIASLILF